MNPSLVQISRQLAVVGIISLTMSLGTLFTLSVGGGVSFMSSSDSIEHVLSPVRAEQGNEVAAREREKSIEPALEPVHPQDAR